MTRPCLPPLPTHQPAAFELPRLACDCHAHVFGPFDRFPLAQDRSYTPQAFPAPAFIEHLDRFGFARGVLVTASASGPDNTVVLDALRQFPGRLRAVVVPSAATTEKELAQWHDLGVRGVRVNLFQRDGHQVYRNGIGLEVIEAMAPHLRRWGWHVQVWIHAPDLPALAPRLLALDLPLVVDHMGRMATSRGVDDPGFVFLCRMLERGQAWTKISGADRNTAGGRDYADVDPFARALLQANPSRVVWGSDWPHINYFDPAHMPDDGALVNLLARWLPEPALRQRVLVDNPASLYGFPA